MASDRTEFDALRAKMWKAEVDSEFAAVKDLLRKVNEECSKDPVGDDTIMKAIEVANYKLNEQWTQLGNVYDKVQEKLGESFSGFEKAINEGVRLVEEMKSKIRL